MLLKELSSLLNNFENLLETKDLRKKVIALIPAFRKLRDVGCSIIPEKATAPARDRILHYLLKYPHKIIKGDELMVVSGIGEWARRVRELRVQFGYQIITGKTIAEMNKEEAPSLFDSKLPKLKPDDYMLQSKVQDKEAAFRWNAANVLRKRKDLSVRDKILQYIRDNVGKHISGEELRYVAGNRTEWARRVRELRTEYGWPIVTKNYGRPDLPIGVYVLEKDKQSRVHDRNIPDLVRSKVLMRDKHKCQSCNWEQSMWTPSDPRNLELHHKKHHAKGGENTEINLLTLCNICHDDIHRKK